MVRERDGEGGMVRGEGEEKRRRGMVRERRERDGEGEMVRERW